MTLKNYFDRIKGRSTIANELTVGAQDLSNELHKRTKDGEGHVVGVTVMWSYKLEQRLAQNSKTETQHIWRIIVYLFMFEGRINKGTFYDGHSFEDSNFSSFFTSAWTEKPEV